LKFFLTPAARKALKNLDKRIAEGYPSKGHLKLTRFSTAEAYSFPGA
jgi:hypothetical protein